MIHPMATPFRGWSDEVFGFYEGLEADNSRSYWQEHKAVYDDRVRAPFDALSELVADEFGPLKVFRPNRDVRFSKDKSPYKTRCYGVAEGEGAETYYVEISARGLVAGSGYWMMAKDQLQRYREAVDDEGTGAELAAIVADLQAGGTRIEHQGLKTAPRGYPRDHPRVELLRAKSLAAIDSWEPARWMGTAKAATRITGTWRAAAPMNAWLAAHVGPTTEPPTSRWG
jgi:uncharacterized protein (TIGR02453 family)